MCSTIEVQNKELKINLYGKENKNMQMEESLTFETFEVIAGIIYAQTIEKRVLVRIGPDGNKPEVLNTTKQYHFKNCIRLKNKLYFADNMGKALVEYDVKQNLYQTYEIDSYLKDNNNIAGVAQSDDHIFIISQYNGKIFVFDSVNKLIEREEVLEKRIKCLFGENTEVILRALSIDETIYLFVNSADSYYICKYNMNKRILEEVSEKIFQYNMRCACCFQRKIYILQDDFTLCIWNTVNNETQIIEMTALRCLLKEKTLKHAYAFSALAVTQKNVWLFPAGDNEGIYIFDFLKNSAYVHEQYPPDFHYLYRKNWSKYADIKEREGQIYVAAKLSNYYLKIDVSTGKGTWNPMGTCDFTEYYQEHFLDLIGEKEKERKIAYEDSEYIFKIFLQYPCQSKQRRQADKLVGQAIWKTMK